jgi:hypothetical protein
MGADRFHDPDPPVAGQAARAAVIERARRLRRRRQRFQMVLPVAVVAAAVVAVAVPWAGLRSTSVAPGTNAGTNPGTAPAPTTPVSHCPDPAHRTVYDSEGVRFVHPSCWATAHFPEPPEAFSTPLVDLSNQAMHGPCTTIPSTPGGSVCGRPVTSLAPGGILVLWTSDGHPGWSLDTEPGSSLTVGGRPAREVVTGPGEVCRPVGADRSITVVVSSTPSDDFYTMTACLKGPGLSRLVSEVRAMVASTTFTDS